MQCGDAALIEHDIAAGARMLDHQDVLSMSSVCLTVGLVSQGVQKRLIVADHRSGREKGLCLSTAP